MPLAPTEQQVIGPMLGLSQPAEDFLLQALVPELGSEIPASLQASARFLPWVSGTSI